MNRLIAITAVIVGVLSYSLLVNATTSTDATWILLGIDVHTGAVTVRDAAADADTVSVYGEGLPVYQTATACQVALRHAIQKYAGLSHAAGNYGRFLCSDWKTWASSNR